MLPFRSLLSSILWSRLNSNGANWFHRVQSDWVVWVYSFQMGTNTNTNESMRRCWLYVPLVVCVCVCVCICARMCFGRERAFGVLSNIGLYQFRCNHNHRSKTIDEQRSANIPVPFPFRFVEMEHKTEFLIFLNVNFIYLDNVVFFILLFPFICW